VGKKIFSEKKDCVKLIRVYTIVVQIRDIIGISNISHTALLYSDCMLYMHFQVLFKVIFNFIHIAITKLHCSN